MSSIGCPEEYECVLVDSLTQATIAHLPWSKITWQRVRNEISIASVVVPASDQGVGCCPLLDKVFPWETMLRIERNSTIVWDGPVTGWTKQRGSFDVTVKAHDRAVLMQKRLIHTYRFFEDQPPDYIIRVVLDDSGVTSGPNRPYPLAWVGTQTTAELVTREIFVERLERTYDVIKELVDNSSTGYYCCVRSYIYTNLNEVRDQLGSHTSGRCPIVSEANTIGTPGVDVDGLGMITTAFAGAAGQGVNGFAYSAVSTAGVGVFLTSDLEMAAPSARTGEANDLSRLAGRAAAENVGPKTNIEQIELAPNFGSEFMASDLSNLIPGVQFRINYDTSCALNVPFAEYRELAGVPGVEFTTAVIGVRMDQLDVTVARQAGGGIDETVLASCRPVITGSVS